MWGFSKKKSLEESGVFNGFTDWHSHILPGVDDGIQRIEDSLAVLREYERMGFKKVWLTPHVMEDFPNETAKLKERFEELKKAWTGSTEIRLASENMLDTLFEERLEKKDFLPIGDEGRHLLVETSYYTPPYAMDEMLEKARKIGYYLILAHPERYRYMDEKDYRRLKENGVLFQMNFMSIVGAYGETARKKAEWLLDAGMIDMMGSDVHRLDHVLNNIKQSPKKNSHLEMMKRVAAQDPMK
ncbi:MAG: capsular biosynthesis protein [Muribaculaceae bacterium]|nr:capsular biosynthesis protein [Muribaculaceae bacterium]